MAQEKKPTTKKPAKEIGLIEVVIVLTLAAISDACDYFALLLVPVGIGFAFLIVTRIVEPLI